MAKVYVFLADGFEDVEALIPIDVLRRGGVDVTTVSITDFPLVQSAHGVNIEADMMFEQGDFADADLLFLPGGMPGASNLFEHKGVCKAMQALEDAKYTGDLVTVDGNVTTGEGPAAAFPFAYELLAQLVDKKTSDQIAEGMRFKHLMA